MPDITTKNLGKYVHVVSTTAALAAVANPINTKGKYKGKQVFNETTGILVIAADATAGGVWKNSGTGAAAHTPA
jgi:hypothetical protein